MYKVQINFSGLIAFVPHTDEAEKMMMVLMLDGSYPHQAPDHEALFPHFPFIHYRLDDLADESPRRPELSGKGYGVSFLSLEELTIGEQPCSKASLSFNNTVGNTSDEPSAGCSDEDLCWILPIHKIGKTATVSDEDLRIDPLCLASTYQVTQPNRIAARTKLCQGRLFNRDFHRKGIAGESLNSLCRFSGELSGKSTRSQMISIMVTYEPKIPDYGPWMITSWRFDLPSGGTKAAKDLPDFVFKNPNEIGRNVVINMWNAPFADLLDLLGEKSKHQWDRPTGDRSFRSYFRLCRRPPAELPVLQREGRVATHYQKVVDSTEKDFGCPKGSFAAEDLDAYSEKVEDYAAASTPAAPPPGSAAGTPRPAAGKRRRR
jgi:hypothetical protein